MFVKSIFHYCSKRQEGRLEIHVVLPSCLTTINNITLPLTSNISQTNKTHHVATLMVVAGGEVIEGDQTPTAYFECRLHLGLH